LLVDRHNPKPLPSTLLDLDTLHNDGPKGVPTPACC